MAVDVSSRLRGLETGRLVLRPMRVGDAEAMFAFKGDSSVTVRYGQEPHLNVEDTRAWIEPRVAGQGKEDSMFWAITLKPGDQAIGECCLWNFDSSLRCAEVGYELHPAHCRKGLMAEALSAVVAFGFGELGLHRIEACPLAANEGSCGLLLKLGFRHEGTLRQRHLFRGRFEDQLYLGLLRDEWAEGAKPPSRAPPPRTLQ